LRREGSCADTVTVTAGAVGMEYYLQGSTRGGRGERFARGWCREFVAREVRIYIGCAFI
jgi:hypothetical protein